MSDEREGSSFEFAGLLFGDVYTIASHHTAAGTSQPIPRSGMPGTAARIEGNQDGEFESFRFEAGA